jgi:Spy/CpxP family protein refolding chaperone
MKKLIGFFLLIIVVAAAAAFCTGRIMTARGSCCATASASAHDWLHDQLQLTPEQQKALEPIEARFHEDYQRANAQLLDANRELARTLGQTKDFSPEVTAAIEKVHHRMGALQKLSIQHIFEMKPLLTPEQNDRLLHYAQQALENSP